MPPRPIRSGVDAANTHVRSSLVGADGVVALDADHPTSAAANDVRDARAVGERRAGRASGIDEERIEHRASRGVQRIDAGGGLDRHGDVAVAIAERRPAHGRRSGRHDPIEEAPAVELDDAAAHQRVRRQGVGTG